ncbi:MAG: hypothetical protein FD146_2589 [Anaerolineaceae bacterium]|nr:MAG: hypothetical protein FD146_2589 [Anaerolineaceae bacterium]
MARNRYTSQIKQEQISRQQLSERFTDYGWIPTPVSTDLGEDFIVHIFIDNEATGVTFHLQEKSVTNLLERRNSDYLSYPLKVKDLKHWESFLQPVVLIVWDIKLREGRWAIIQDLVPRIDAKQPEWRLKPDTSKISVNIPWGNRTDNSGLAILKRTIGHFCYPLISRGKELQTQITIAFPQTSRGKEAAKGFDDFIKEGTPISLQGEYIQDFSFSDWWTKWFGDIPSDSLVVELDSVPKVYEVAIQVISRDQVQSQGINTELALLRAGSQRMQFSSARKKSPLHCNLDVRFTPTGQSGKVTFSIASGGISALDAKQAINFLRAIQDGGKISFAFPENSEQLNFDLPSNPTGEISDQFASWVDKLIMIQNKTGKFFRIPEKGLTNDDGADIEELFDIVSTGCVKLSNMTITMQIKGDALRRLLGLQKDSKPAPRFRISHPEFSMELLGVNINLGPTVQEFQGAFATDLAEFEEMVGRADDETYLPVIFDKVEVIKRFPNWGKG